MRAGRTGELSNLQFALLLALPVIAFLLLVVVYPLGYAVWLSLHKIKFFGGYRATFVGPQNFVDIARSADFWQSTLDLDPLHRGVGGADPRHRPRHRPGLARPFRGRALVRALIILPWSVSLYGTGVIFFYLTSSQGGVISASFGLFGGDQPMSIINTSTVVEVLSIGNAWNLAPLVGFFLAANIATMPGAALPPGRGRPPRRFATFLHVTLPPLRFTLFVFACIATTMSLSLFDYVYLMTGGGPGRASAVLPYELYKIKLPEPEARPTARRCRSTCWR